MLSLLNLPKLPYILFELIRFPILNQGNEGRRGMEEDSVLGSPEEADVLLFDVKPTRLNYGFSGKKAVMHGKGDDNFNIDKSGLAPTNITLSGTFGQRFINRGIKIQDGFGRLKEFEQFFKKSQSVSIEPNIDPLNRDYVYAANFFDFTKLRWGACELDLFEEDSNAQVHSILPFYTLRGILATKLIEVETRDPILRNLKFAIQIQEQFDQWNVDIENFLKENEIASIANEFVVDTQMFFESLNAVGRVAGQYSAMINEFPLRTETSILTNSITNFGDLF